MAAIQYLQVDTQTTVLPVATLASTPADMLTGHWSIHWIPLADDASSPATVTLASIDSGVDGITTFQLIRNGGLPPLFDVVVTVDGTEKIRAGNISWAAGNRIEFYFGGTAGKITITGALTNDGSYFGGVWSMADGELSIGAGHDGAGGHEDPCAGYISAPYPGAGDTPQHPLGLIPGLVKRHDASVSSSVVLSGSNVTQWSDLSGNDRHDVVGAGVSPTYAADVITFGATQSLQYATESVDTLIGSKEFLYVVDCGTGLRSGALPGVPRLYFGGTAVSYNSLNVLTYSDASGVLVVAHDGSDIFVRRDGVELGRATLALSALTPSAWYAAVTATCTMTRYALYDASGWGASFATNLAAVETAFGV